MGQGATTVHAMLHIPVYDKQDDDQQHQLKPLSGQALRELQELLVDTRVFFLDEMSTIGTRKKQRTLIPCMRPLS